MSVTEVRSYFTPIIGRNSVNVHRIPTKLGTAISCNEPFKCAKFQPDWNTNIRALWWILQSVRNEEGKIKEIKMKFWLLVSQKCLE